MDAKQLNADNADCSLDIHAFHDHALRLRKDMQKKTTLNFSALQVKKLPKTLNLSLKAPLSGPSERRLFCLLSLLCGFAPPATVQVVTLVPL